MSTSDKHLPPGAIKLIADLGRDDALRVIEALGGMNWQIPSPGVDNLTRRLLVGRIGEPLADKLSALYGGAKEIHIPSCRRWRQAERDATICRRYREAINAGDGVTYAKAVLAMEYGITSASVSAILKEGGCAGLKEGDSE